MRVKRYVLVSAAVLAAGAGGGAAIAASTNDDRQKTEASILDDAAKRLNVTPEALRSALGAAEDAQLDARVKAGQLTQEQAEAVRRALVETLRLLGRGGSRASSRRPCSPSRGAGRRSDPRRWAGRAGRSRARGRGR